MYFNICFWCLHAFTFRRSKNILWYTFFTSFPAHVFYGHKFFYPVMNFKCTHVLTKYLYRQYTFILHFSIFCFIFILSLKVCSLMWLLISFPLFYISYLYACFLNTCSLQRSFLYYIFLYISFIFQFHLWGIHVRLFHMSVLHGGFAFGYSLICEVFISFSHTFFYIFPCPDIFVLSSVFSIYISSLEGSFFFFMPGVQGTAKTGQK